MIKKLKEALLSAIYPKQCIFCGNVMSLDNYEDVCNSCQQQIMFLEDNVCQKCGKPLEKGRAFLCYDCIKTPHIFEQGRALWIYEGMIKKSIHDFKYHNMKRHAVYFSEALWNYYIHNISWNIDGIISVPLHSKRKKERGYNQAELLSKGLSKRLGIPHLENALIRTVNTVPQKDLSDLKRLNNVLHVFKMCKNVNLKCNNILIVDDIYTTGSTIDACSRVLKGYGVHKVYFLTLAIGRGF